nr:fimbrillin family protein [Bacteroides intestinalis]
MKKIMILATVAAALAACNNEEDAFVDNRDPNVIYMTAGVDASAAMTRTLSNFPNQTVDGAKIAVVARYYDNTDLATNWEDPYIDNEPASVSDNGNGGYSFTWTKDQYWPVGGNKLQFIAYSPIVNESNSCIVTNADKKSLTITLPATDNTQMPDIIVANRTNESNEEDKKIIGYKANTSTGDGNVNEGAQNPVTIDMQFRHILSQLDVIVKGSKVNATNEAVVSKVEVIVADNATKKTFDMEADLTPATSVGFTNETGTASTYTYTGAWSLNSGAHTVNGSRCIYLFPETESSVTVRIYVKDASTLSCETQLPDVVLGSVTNGGYLKKGKKTTLTVTIEGTDVVLTGAVSAWENQGEYNATIK